MNDYILNIVASYAICILFAALLIIPAYKILWDLPDSQVNKTTSPNDLSQIISNKQRQQNQ
jgi:hypothetical protein